MLKQKPQNSNHLKPLLFLWWLLIQCAKTPYAEAMQPRTASEIFKVFLLIGGTAFGGGGSAHVQHHLVERLKWLSLDDYLECYTLVQTLPGPTFSNLCTHSGARLGGWRGGLAAMAGVNLPGLTMILLIAALYSSFSAQPVWLEGFLKGVAVAAVAISFVALVRVAPGAFRTRPSVGLALAAFVANAVLHVNILWVMVVLVPIGMMLEWRHK
jgi:chromate transporter